MELANKMTEYALNEWLAPFTEEETEDFRRKCENDSQTVKQFLDNLEQDVNEYPTTENQSLLSEVREHYNTLERS